MAGESWQYLGALKANVAATHDASISGTPMSFQSGKLRGEFPWTSNTRKYRKGGKIAQLPTTSASTKSRTTFAALRIVTSGTKLQYIPTSSLGLSPSTY